MDPDIIDTYIKHKSDPHFVNLPSTVLPDINRYVNLYNAVDGVICTLTTIMVEAAIMNIPSLAIAFNDGKHKLTMDMIIKNKHFEGLDKVNGIIICKEKKDFINSCNKLIELIEKKNISEELKNSIKYIAYSDLTTYDERLYKRISNIMNNC